MGASKKISEELLSVKEMCELFKVSRVTIYNWTKSGYLSPIKLGATVRYRKSDIKKLISRKESE